MRRYLALAALLLIPSISFACLWDYDTLKQERARFPDALELITGKFLRHSPEFYQWRIQDRLKKLKTDPKNPSLYDDLAVAYAKTGDYKKAIETMEAVEKFAPGRYETYSNLGTFHFLAGDIPKALPLIDKALAINPDAHFGREKYQKWLGEYLLANPRQKLPIVPGGGFSLPDRGNSFAVFLRSKLGKERLELADLEPAVKAVLGMMRFANHENPVLLEVLGDLLSHNTYVADTTAKRMASRAYMKASQVMSDPESRAAYVQLAKEALKYQTRLPESNQQLTLEELTPQFEKEMKDADQWYADLKARETGWINSGADPEAEFDKLYDHKPRVDDEPNDDMMRRWWHEYRSELAVGSVVFGVVALLVVVGFIAWRLRRQAAATGTSSLD